MVDQRNQMHGSMSGRNELLTLELALPIAFADNKACLLTANTYTIAVWQAEDGKVRFTIYLLIFSPALR